MSKKVCIIGAGLAGSEAALQLAKYGVTVVLYEARPHAKTPVHKTEYCAELVCSNSLKSEKPDSAAGLLKQELTLLDSFLLAAAFENRVAAGGALAVERDSFAQCVTQQIVQSPLITLVRAEVQAITKNAHVCLSDGTTAGPFDAFIIASGPLTSDTFATWLAELTGQTSLFFYDAAAPIVYADSLNSSILFSQNRYVEGAGDYLNAPFTKAEYENFIAELIAAQRVVARDFETKELFSACQPIEEIARKGQDAPRFGPLKPIGLTDPATGKRPWAAVQLRAEDKYGQSYNLVGFQTNLTFPEQERVFRLIPGLEHAEFARLGVMHRNTFLDAPRLMSPAQELICACSSISSSVFLAGQITGTEGYCEAIRSGLQAALEVCLKLSGKPHINVPQKSAYGALLSYATDEQVTQYQPMHVNFGIMPPLDAKVKNKRERYAAYAVRAQDAMCAYFQEIQASLEC